MYVKLANENEVEQYGGTTYYGFLAGAAMG
jgi:hypothetical protein